MLFAVDNRATPFERAYFITCAAAEPRIVYAGSEVSVFDDLAGYLESWHQSLS